MNKDGIIISTALEPQFRFGDKPLKLSVFCPQSGAAALKESMLLLLLCPEHILYAHWWCTGN